jgi:hypothetical protein
MPIFFPGHLAAVADSYDTSAANRDEQAQQFEQQGDVASAEQCRQWAAACRSAADTIRNH